MHLEESIGIILMMYNQLQLNAVAISSSGGRWVKLTKYSVTWLVGFPVLTRAYDNNGRCPRQKLVFGILQRKRFTNYK